MEKRKQIDEALVTEMRNCAEADGDKWLMGRCYGLAHALAIELDTSTDEELYRVAEENGLMDMAAQLFKWSVGI